MRTPRRFAFDGTTYFFCSDHCLRKFSADPAAYVGGAKPEPMAVWLRHRVPALNWLLRSRMEAVPHAEAPERNPFKAPPNLAEQSMERSA